MAGELGAPCYPKSICGGDGLLRSTRLLSGPVESVTFCPFRSKVYEVRIEGTCSHNLPGETVRTGREHRYPGLLMPKGCGIERKQGDPGRTSGPIQASPAFKFEFGGQAMKTREYKIIQDPVNGPVKLPADMQKVIDSPEFQRLRYIRALGLCNLVFPGANHSRFEHSLGTMHLATLFSEALSLEDKDLAAVSALLHDVGHPPLSHSNEDIFQKMTGHDHLQAGLSIIEGKGEFSGSSLPGVLESIGIDPKDVASVLLGKRKDLRVLSRLISGPMDVDELDYMRRDSLYCGVQIGNVDHRRILNVALVHDNDIMVEEKGLGTIESVLIARILMYGTVYFHKTSRIAQTMTGYVIRENMEQFPHPFQMDDNDLFQILKGLKNNRIAQSLLKRELFKPVFKLPYKPELAVNIKEALEKESSLGEYDYIVDIIPPLEFSGPGRIKSDLSVLTPNGTMNITDVSPLVRALRETLENRTIVVSAPLWSIEGVKKTVEKAIA